MARARSDEPGDNRALAADQTISALGATTAALWSQLSEMRWDLSNATAQIAELEQQNDGLTRAVEQQGRQLQQIAAADPRASQSAIDSLLWVTNSPLNNRPRVSIVLPTFTTRRVAMLRGAIESVLNQSYGNWELIVVDNSDDAMLSRSPEWWPDDSRIRILRSDPRQVGIARNAGLDVASGELIAYLDDDCRWFPWWLHSAVAAFEASPDSVFVHGIRFSGGSAMVPQLVQANTVTPISLQVDNHVDTNALVHRADVGERWDEQLLSCLDYDLLVRLAERPHTMVPVPAVAYSTDSPERVWSAEHHYRNIEQRNVVIARARAKRPLRIVAFNSFYPLASETYIGDELEALRRCGVDIVLARAKQGPAPCPSRIDAPLYESLYDAVDAHDPDLVLAHWGNTAKSARIFTTERGIPHAVRLHSMCETIPTEEIFDENCIGGWGPPHVDRGHPLSFSLPTLIVDPAPTPESDARGNNLISVSAGLPKKNFAVLFDAVARTGAQIDVVIAMTTGWEDQPDTVRKLLEEAGLPDRMRVNLEYDATQEMIRSAGAMAYSVTPNQPIGQPRTVIEAALAATPLVVPETQSLRDMLGDVAHYYERDDVESLSAAIAEALERPHAFADRVALADRIRHDHSSQEVFEKWTLDLTTALVEWQADHDRDQSWAQRQWWMRR